MFRSLRSTLILASVLWTAGLLMLMHLLSMMFLHVMPRFSHSNPGPIAIGLLFMLAGVAALRQGLIPFRRLRDRLLAIRLAAGQRVDGVYPSEVQPLVDELNAVLADREDAVRRALATAGDLAHGLKTPLALLAQEAERAEALGNREIAATLDEQVDRMSRQVNYHLARARAAASSARGTARCNVAQCADGVVRTLLKLHSRRGVQISIEVSQEIRVRMQQEDLEEILGNLLENASRFAREHIVVAARRADAQVELTVDDDGPGLDPSQRTQVLERGVRLDEASPGWGLGLAIVRDLAELYGGSIQLEEAPLGGLRARLTLPGA